MKSLLIRCYPARWRARYGDEFEAILEERPLGPFDVADILLGALDAQLRLRRSRGRRHPRKGTSPCLCASAASPRSSAAPLLALAWYLGIRPHRPSTPSFPGLLLITGSLALLVALAGLTAFQARTDPHFTWAAFVVPAIGTSRASWACRVATQ